MDSNLSLKVNNPTFFIDSSPSLELLDDRNSPGANEKSSAELPGTIDERDEIEPVPLKRLPGLKENRKSFSLGNMLENTKDVGDSAKRTATSADLLGSSLDAFASKNLQRTRSSGKIKVPLTVKNMGTKNVEIELSGMDSADKIEAPPATDEDTTGSLTRNELNRAINQCLRETPYINNSLRESLMKSKANANESLISMRVGTDSRVPNLSKKTHGFHGQKPKFLIIKESLILLFYIYWQSFILASIMALFVIALWYVPWKSKVSYYNEWAIWGLVISVIVMYFVVRSMTFGMGYGRKNGRWMFLRFFLPSILLIGVSTAIPLSYGYYFWTSGIEYVLIAIMIFISAIAAYFVVYKRLKKKKLFLNHVITNEIVLSLIVGLFPLVIFPWYIVQKSDLVKCLFVSFCVPVVREIGLQFGRHHCRRFKFVEVPERVQFMLLPYELITAMYGKLLLIMILDFQWLLVACLVSFSFETFLRLSMYQRDSALYGATHDKQLRPVVAEFAADNRVGIVYAAISNTELLSNVFSILLLPALQFLFYDHRLIFDLGGSPFAVDLILKTFPVLGLQLLADMVFCLAESIQRRTPLREVWQRRLENGFLVKLVVVLGCLLLVILGQRTVPSSLLCDDIHNVCTCGFRLHCN